MTAVVVILIGAGVILGCEHGRNQCDPFTRNRGSTGDAWQSNLITDDLMRGEIPLLPDGRQTALSPR
jgi:hypothetical protein